MIYVIEWNLCLMLAREKLTEVKALLTQTHLLLKGYIVPLVNCFLLGNYLLAAQQST